MSDAEREVSEVQNLKTPEDVQGDVSPTADAADQVAGGEPKNYGRGNVDEGHADIHDVERVSDDTDGRVAEDL